MIRRLMHILSRPSVLVLLFCLSLTLYCWPLLSTVESGSLAQAHFSFFFIWAIIVLALWVITRAIEVTNPEDEETSYTAETRD